MQLYNDIIIGNIIGFLFVFWKMKSLMWSFNVDFIVAQSRTPLFSNFCTFFRFHCPKEKKIYNNDSKVFDGIFKLKDSKMILLFNSFVIRYKVIHEYQRLMKNNYNLPATKIPSMSFSALIEEKEFVDKVQIYGEKVAKFLIDFFEISEENFDLIYKSRMQNCFLETRHLAGTADFIIGDTIIDLKCTSTIKESFIKQCLSYYYLTEKLQIKGINKIMIYEAVKDKYIIIDVEKGLIESNVNKCSKYKES